MPTQVRKQIVRMLSDKRRRNEYLAALALLAVVVTIGVASVLTQQGHAATKEVQVLDCPVTGVVAHAHDESCYDGDGNLVCPLPEREIHIHDDSCYAEERVLVCGLEEGEDHTHTDECYEVERTLVCGLDEVAETHVHGPGCFRTVEVPVEDEAEPQAADQTDTPVSPGAESAAALAQDPTLAETHPEQSFYHEFKDADDQLVMRVDVKAKAGALPKGTTMEATWVDPETLSAKQQDAVDGAIAAKAEGQVLGMQAVDISFRDADGAEVEPRIPVTVTFVSPMVDTDDQALVVHIQDLTEAQKKAQEQAIRDGASAEEAEPRRTAEAVEALSDQALAERDVATGDDRLSFDSDQFSTYVLAVTSLHKVMQASDGSTVTVTVDAPAEAGIPQGAELQVREVARGGSDWQAYESQALAALGADEAELARFFDIAILGEDGQEIQPAEPVRVEISLADAPEHADASVVHFGDAPEVLPATEDAGVATFDATGFSVWGVVYTKTLQANIISAHGDNYEITVTYGEDAEIPDGATLAVREIVEGDAQYRELRQKAEAAYEANHEAVPENLAIFDISIMDGDTEVEPAEGSVVSVDVRMVGELAQDMLAVSKPETAREGAPEQTVSSNVPAEFQDEAFPVGSGIWLNGTPVSLLSASDDAEGTEHQIAVSVAHYDETDGMSLIEDVQSGVEGESSLTVSFATDSFSIYCYGAYQTEYTGFNNLDELPNVLYVGETILLQGDNARNFSISNVTNNCAELSSRGNDQHRIISINDEGTFTINFSWYGNTYSKTLTVKKRTSTPYSDTIETVDNNDIGITMSLFDYDLDNQLNELWNRTYDGEFNNNRSDAVRNYYLSHGINNGHALKFWAGGPTWTTVTGHPEYNAWLGDTLGTTIVSTDMNAAGYPQLTNGESLEYLFSKSDGTDKKYYPANKLFSEEDGYYVYNSGMTSDGGAGHYAYFNKETREFEVYDSTYYYTKDGQQFPIGFFPFTQLDEDAVKDGFLSSNQYPNHHFGMSMSVDFDIPEDKLDSNDNHITFEFSGDDDMWVFVDGKLVLDIGGIHQPIGGKIDFTTGTVTYQDKNGNTLTTNAYSPDLNTLIGNRGVAVNSYGTHTLQVFYMERGGGDSNCMIKFNTIPYKRIKFNKIDANNNRIPGAVFKLYEDEQCTVPVMIPRTKTVSGRKVNYYEEATSTSNDNGEVIFDKIPIGTYYMKETTAPEGYDADEKVYTAVVTATRVGDPADENYATIYWVNESHPIGSGVVNYEQIPLEVTKKWVKAGTSEEASWPEGCEISYKVIRHAYLETDDGLKEIPGTETVVFTGQGDSLLTKDHTSHVVENLSQVGTWKAPLAITAEMQALGIEANTEYPVKYRYTVVENPAGSELPAGSPYVLLPVQAEMTENAAVTVGGQAQQGIKGLLTNEITELEVLKTWADGDDQHTDDKVTVQLYRTTVKGDTPPVIDEPTDDEISIMVTTQWLYDNGTTAEDKDIPRAGTITAQISDGEHTWDVELNPSNNWTATQTDLPMKDDDGKNITYTVTYLQQQSGDFGGADVQSVVVTQPAAFSGANGKATLVATVAKPEPVNTTMDVPFTGTWVNDKGETVTPPDNAEITAVVKDDNGDVVTTVTLNKANGWKATKTLPCIKDDVTVHYTVEYSGKGDNVTSTDGTHSFSGQGSTVEAIGQISVPEVADGKMALRVVANGIVATGSDQWQIQVNQTVHRVDQNNSDVWDKNQYSFPDGLLKESTTSTTITDMNVKDGNNQTIRYKMHVQAEHITKGTITVVDPSGKVLQTQNFTNGWNGDLYFNAAPGMFTVFINGETATTTNKVTVAKKAAALLKAPAAEQKTFTDEISHSGLRLPADADPVGDPVELSSASDWKHLFDNLPVTDSEGNTYYYYLKEVSATTDVSVAEIGAVYEYDDYGESGRIMKLTIENKPKVVKAEVRIEKVDEDGEPLSGVPFTLWQKGGAGSTGGEYAKVAGYVDVTTANGSITFAELLPGDYKITEGTPLPGYLALGEEIAFTIDADGKVTGFTDTAHVTLDEDEGTFVFTVVNQKGKPLPNAGGVGTWGFTIVGMAMMATAGAMLLLRRRAA